MNWIAFAAGGYFVVGCALLIYFQVRAAKKSVKKERAAIINLIGELSDLFGQWGLGIFSLLWPI